MKRIGLAICSVVAGLAMSSAMAQSPQSAPNAAAQASVAEVWGAIAFTADGSYSSVWKSVSKPEAEAHVLKGCAKLGRGACEVISFPGSMCAALAHYDGSHSGKRWRISHTGGAKTSSDAQKAALENCRNSRNVRGQCQLRTVVCGDGR